MPKPRIKINLAKNVQIYELSRLPNAELEIKAELKILTQLKIITELKILTKLKIITESTYVS